MSDMVSEKRRLRAQFKTTRRQLVTSEFEQLSEQLNEQLIHYIARYKPKAVKGFIPYAGEPNIWSFIQYCWKHDIAYIVPKCEQKTSSMNWYSIKQQDDLVLGAYNLLEPNPNSCEQVYDEVELVLVPGLAFTAEGDRLGYGGGYYDRFYERAKHDVKQWIGIAFELFVCEQLPTEKHDFKCNYIVTNAGVIACKVEEKGRL